MKYLTFSPYYSGLSNVIMSYELALSLAYLTERTLVLPPDCWLLFICRQEFSDYTNIWDVLNRDKLLAHFDCIWHKDVPEFQDKFERIRDQKSYTGALHLHETDLLNIKFGGTSLAEFNWVFTNGLSDTEEFESFTRNRDIINLQSSRKFLHFENNLFGHFAYHIFVPGYDNRNEMKRKINEACSYHPRFYELADKVKAKLGPYNAVHIRRGDFRSVRHSTLADIDEKETVCARLEQMYSTDLPLYIATDEKDKDFFSTVKEKFDVHFFNDFDYEVNQLEEAILEQVICSQAELFYGTYMSTYTTRINVMRGVEGRQTCDYGGVNHFIAAEDSGIDFSSAFPWEQKQGNWNWEWSYHCQWMKEVSEGVLESTHV